MGKSVRTNNGILMNTTRTKQIYIDGNNTTYVPIPYTKKVKGHNYRKVSCTECGRPRDIRGKLCNRCRMEIIKNEII